MHEPQIQPPGARSRRGLWVSSTSTIAAVALAGITYGFSSLYLYDAGPGPAAEPPAQWPTQTLVALDPVRPTLVLFAHPHCPCTAATVGELDRLMSHCGDRVAVSVLFYTDPELGPGWEKTDLWDHAARIPGVRTQADALGATARRFGAYTSGTVVLYAPDGRLLFHGGITASRGHAGDSPGAAAILDLVRGDTPTVHSAAVYGCGIVGPAPERRM